MATPKEFKIIKFALVWLDAHVETDDNRETNRRLGKDLGRLRSFTNVKECQTFLEQHKAVEEFVLIVSGQLGSELVPLIHDLSNISSIYVYCAWKENSEKWSKKFEKVRYISYVIFIQRI
jgi:predicted hydrocarbon binding protein